jgi:hypothetical protein
VGRVVTQHELRRLGRVEVAERVQGLVDHCRWCHSQSCMKVQLSISSHSYYDWSVHGPVFVLPMLVSFLLLGGEVGH